MYQADPNLPGLSDLSDLTDEIELPDDVSRLVDQSIATPETHDRRLVQDHSNLLFNAVAQVNRPDQHRLLGDAGLFFCTRQKCITKGRAIFRVLTGPKEILACSQCMSFAFKILCSTVDNQLQVLCANRECRASYPVLEIHATGGKRELSQHLQFICFDESCGAAFPVLEVSPVQMNDRIAKAHGLYIQDPRSFPKPAHPWRNRGMPGRKN